MAFSEEDIEKAFFSTCSYWKKKCLGGIERIHNELEPSRSESRPIAALELHKKRTYVNKK